MRKIAPHVSLLANRVSNLSLKAIALSAAVLLVDAGMIRPAHALSISEDEISIVDCNGVPRLTERVSAGNTVSLVVETASGAAPATLVLEQGSQKLTPSIEKGQVRCPTVEPGVLRLCGDGAQEIRFEPIQGGFPIAGTTLAAAGIGGAIIGISSTGSSNGNGGGSNAQPLGAAGAGAPQGEAPAFPAAAPNPENPATFPIGEPAEPLSPYR